MGKYLCMERFREMGQQLFVRLDQSKKFIVNLKYIFCFYVDKIVLIYLKKKTKLDTVNPLNLRFFCESTNCKYESHNSLNIPLNSRYHY